LTHVSDAGDSVAPREAVSVQLRSIDMRAYVISLFLLVAIPSTLSAQSAPPDVLSALLGEVRQLRSVMERVVTTAPRIQLLASRLAVQNERLSRASRDLSAVQQDLDRAAAEASRIQAQFQGLESVLSTETDMTRRRAFTGEQGVLKQQLDALAADEQRLRARETELSGILALEQTQWAELNRRLDELERELSIRQ
jgi:predicted  nucleic acid-binding Zn-ribbon protein